MLFSFHRLSDEVLFEEATRGNKMAKDILLRRFELIGFHIATNMIRSYALKNASKTDFVDSIYDSILKSLRYYVPGETKFYNYCRNILTQNLYIATVEKTKAREVDARRIDLDANVSGDNEITYHEIIPDKSSLVDLDNDKIERYCDSLSSSSSEDKRLQADVLRLHNSGYTTEEIAAKLNQTLYQIRKSRSDIRDGIKNFDIDITLN